MKTLISVFALVMAGSMASAQDLGDAPAKIALPGITFTRALNGAAANATVSGNKLTLKGIGKRDNFRDPDGKLTANTAGVLLAPVDNTKPFTLSAKLTPKHDATYDAGALYIWVKDDLWFKFAMERDERGHVRIVSVRTTGTSDDNNHDVVTVKPVTMKISSNTKAVGFYYSVDNGKNWQLIRVFKNEYPAKLWVGVSSQSPMGNGNSTVFEDVSLTAKSITDFRMGK